LTDKSLDISCIVAIVERGKADKIVNAAKSAGATGATILYGRGTGATEAKRFLNIHIESSKEIIFIISEDSKKKKIMKAMVEAGRLKDPGTGIIYSVKISDLLGLHHRTEFNE
jgi:nitrogen regulatory protein PII